MSGYVEEIIEREEAIERVSGSLGFPWTLQARTKTLDEAAGCRLADDHVAGEQYPSFSRSLRDGYAVRAGDVRGASDQSPVFLRLAGESPMGAIPKTALSSGEAVSIFTGGAIPDGANAVVMQEHSSMAGEFVEIRKSVQKGENIMLAGEEIEAGKLVAAKGEMIDFRSSGVLATMGITRMSVMTPRIGVFSTGDEIVSSATTDVPPGKIRDVNSHTVRALLKESGFESVSLGILPDDADMMACSVLDSLEDIDVLMITGGSSVSVRDHTSDILSSIGPDGLLVRGINISPGKPTLVGGNRNPGRLVIGLPGHPLSCLIVMVSFVMPLLGQLLSGRQTHFCSKGRMTAARDFFGRSGVEEFIPASFDGDGVYPLWAKSGYVGILGSAKCLVRIPRDRETFRAGESAEVWLW